MYYEPSVPTKYTARYYILNYVMYCIFVPKHSVLGNYGIDIILLYCLAAFFSSYFALCSFCFGGFIIFLSG